MNHKIKKDKLDFIEIKNLCPFKDIVKKMKVKPQTERRYLQYTYISVKGLVSRIYKKKEMFSFMLVCLLQIRNLNMKLSTWADL